MLAPYPYWEILSRILFGALSVMSPSPKIGGLISTPLAALNIALNMKKKMCSKFRVCNTILLFFM